MMETLVMQGLNYRGDVRLQDGATYADCTFDDCTINGNNLTFRHCTMSVGTRFQNCEGTMTFDGTEFIGEITDEVSGVRFNWIDDMEAIITEPDGTVVHATFNDPEQVAAFKAGLANQN